MLHVLRQLTLGARQVPLRAEKTPQPEAGWTPLTNAVLSHRDASMVVGNSGVSMIRLCNCRIADDALGVNPYSHVTILFASTRDRIF
jgi:hypothetical protein